MRNHLFLAGALCCAASLAACQSLSTAPTSVPPPSQIAAKTIIDEQVALGAEEAYKTFRLAVELGVKAGVIKGATATKAAELDNQLFAALGLVRNAYDTGNADDFNSALTAFNVVLKNANATLNPTGHGGH